jgi:hypothetical protein
MEENGDKNDKDEKVYRYLRSKIWLTINNKMSINSYSKQSLYAKYYFNNFNNFVLLNKRMIEYCDVELCNYCFSLLFEKNGMQINTLMMIGREESNTNIYYEYYVNKYIINPLSKKYMCFMETFNMLNVTIDDVKNINKQNVNMTIIGNVNVKKFNDERSYWESSIKNDRFVSYQTNYVNYERTMEKYFNKLSNSYYEKMSDGDKRSKEIEMKKKELINVLMQVYYVLHELNGKIVHNKLYSNNIVLLDVLGEEYQTMMFDEGKIVLNVKMVAKIVDMSMVWFNIEEQSTDKVMKIIKEISEEKEMMKNGYENLIKMRLNDEKADMSLVYDYSIVLNEMGINVKKGMLISELVGGLKALPR